jgi:hypothetical protein
MIEQRQHFRLAPKAGQPVGIRGERRSTLTATWRFTFVSVARYTSPIPPTPIWAVTS